MRSLIEELALEIEKELSNGFLFCFRPKRAGYSLFERISSRNKKLRSLIILKGFNVK